jgi:DNA-binding beta-propeller fold protein YncE
MTTCVRGYLAAFVVVLAVAGWPGAALAGQSACLSGQIARDQVEPQFVPTPSPPPVRRVPPGPGWLSPQAAAAKNLIYVADSDSVVIFPKGMRNAPPIGKITRGVTSAYGLYLDGDKNLYVANQAENNVEVYAPGSTSPTFTYSDHLKRPLFAIADSRRVFVGNADTGDIVIYERGKNKAERILKSLGVEVDGLNFGTAGYLYAAYRAPGGAGGIEKFPPGGMGQGVDLGIQLNAPQGLVIDPLENMLAVETQGTNRVDLFLRGQTKPCETVGIPRTPEQIALGDLYQVLYVSVLGTSVYTTTYEKFDAPLLWINNSLDGGEQGLAVSPPAER